MCAPFNHNIPVSFAWAISPSSLIIFASQSTGTPTVPIFRGSSFTPQNNEPATVSVSPYTFTNWV